MNLRMVWLVTRRELRDQFKDWRIIIPMIVLTIFFPFLMNFTARETLKFVSSYGGGTLIPERLVPFLLMVIGFFPITVSLVIALESFVGEKERGTIEPLLSSPLKDWQIYLGKLIASSSVPLLTAYLGISVFLLRLFFDHIALPDINLIVQTIFLTSVQAVMMVSGAILISTQSTSVRAANLLSSFIVIPVALLIQGESILMFWGNNQILWLAVFGVTIISFLLMRMGIAHFQRESLLGREIDILNIKWMARTFFHAFKGDAKNIKAWYINEVGNCLRKMRIAIILIFLLGILGGIASYVYVEKLGSVISPNQEIFPTEIKKILDTGIGPFGSETISFEFILSNNLRAITIILLVGLVSFGVLGVIAYLINIGLIGVILALLAIINYSPITVAFTGILPHGIFEIPAIIISSASVFQIGVLLVTPNPRKSLGEILIGSLADWSKVTVGVVLPLLLIAAAIESWITPKFLSMFMK